MKVALTIAGSDSGGGAGIQADLKTFHAFGVFGTSAITAITVQNTLGVAGFHAVPPDIVRAQIHAVAGDLAPAACKSGMLASRELVETVAAAIRAESLGNYVLDPVMVASSGDRLIAGDAEASVLEHLVPLCALVTPNLHEAGILTGRSVRDEAGMRAAAEALVRAGAGAALVKGGHLEGDTVVNLLFDGDRLTAWRTPRIDSRSTHGTGCTLSAAITAGLALGRPLADATDIALEWVHRAIEAAPGLGAGHGPLNHLIAPRSRPRPPSTSAAG